uniref:Uncharacterized protein n=1 Tax=Timema cristinae TaxID=61476 RepID=A0A7R9GTN0_TIMCR|nr:unnamed protein product [Timema cristinae]
MWPLKHNTVFLVPDAIESGAVREPRGQIWDTNTTLTNLYTSSIMATNSQLYIPKSGDTWFKRHSSGLVYPCPRSSWFKI